MKLNSMLVGVAALVAGAFSVPALAAYPDKPVTVICPWTAGGGTDVLLRALSKAAEKHLGQTINVVNQTGGAGAIGHNAIRAARPDGYTVGMITFELNSLPPQGLVPFTWKDFDPLMRINSDPAALTVRKDAPYSTVRGFMDHAKANPGEITIGNSAPGSVWHIAAGLAAEKTGVQVKHVPFDGAQPAVTALVGGHIKAVAVSVAEVRGQVQAGNLKILGVMSADRDKIFPDVPTFTEGGLPGFEERTFMGVFAPAGTPSETVARYREAIRKVVASTEYQQALDELGLQAQFGDGADLAARVKHTNQTWGPVIRESGFVAQ